MPSSRVQVVRRLAVLSAMAFVAYGGWAAWANHTHGASAALRAFLVQGTSSAFTTSVMGGAIERLRRPLGTSLGAKLLASCIATLAGGLCHVTHDGLEPGGARELLAQLG